MKGSKKITGSIKFRKLAFIVVLVLCGTFAAIAQEYLSLTNPAKPGREQQGFFCIKKRWCELEDISLLI